MMNVLWEPRRVTKIATIPMAAIHVAVTPDLPSMMIDVHVMVCSVVEKNNYIYS